MWRSGGPQIAGRVASETSGGRLTFRHGHACHGSRTGGGANVLVTHCTLKTLENGSDQVAAGKGLVKHR